MDCHTLFATSPRDSSPLPTLNAQPPGLPALTYSRGACSAAQRDARIVFGLNTLFVIVALGGLLFVARRLGSHPPESPSPSQIPSPLTA